MNFSYNLLINYLFVIFFFVLLLFSFSIFFVYQEPSIDKNSSYECGFNAFMDARSQFDVRFYIVGLLFLIFDLELVFLFPWVLVFWHLTSMGFISMIIFLLLLVLGFLYEINEGCLIWK